MDRERKTSISFRLSNKLLKALKEEAKFRDIPLGSLLVRMATRYGTFDLFIEQLHPLVLAGETLLSIITELNPEQVEQKGVMAGSRLPALLFKQHNIKPTLDSIMRYYFELLGKYAGWFGSKYFEEEQKIILRHSLGVKWSCFLKGHIGATFRSVLKVDPKIDIDENSVTVHIKLKTGSS